MSGSGLFGDQSPLKPHLVRGGGGLAGEVADLRGDVGRAVGALAAFTVEEFTDVAAADVDAIRLAAAVDDTGERTLSGADLDGAVGGGEMVPPRNITVDTTGATPADAPANVTINGKVRDKNGNLVAQTETIAVSQIVGQAVGALAFSVIDEIVEEQADGTDASLSYGFGDLIGLAQPLVSRAGAAAVLMEIEAGTVLAADAITGTFVDAATAAPNGTYAPATVPDDANDYAVYYEYDPQA
jgi:hypothetical protein